MRRLPLPIRSFPLLLVLAAVGVACSGKSSGTEGGEDDQAGEARQQSSGPPSAAGRAMDSMMRDAQNNGGLGLLVKDEGSISIGPLHTWFKITGVGTTGTPVILIHDGPGGSSFALKSLEALGNERPVVRYDQHGSGRSASAIDAQALKISEWVTELDSVRAHNKYGKVHLIAHGWGGIIALEYYAKHPNNVASITFENPAIDYPLLRESIKEKIAAMPEAMRPSLSQAPKAGTTDRPDYQTAMMTFVTRYVCCVKAIGTDLDSIGATMNDQIYALLRGPNETTINGTLASYTATPTLARVNVPVLFVVGENDIVGVPTVQRFASTAPNGRAEVLKDVRHFPTWEAPEDNTRIIRDFLKQADSGKR